MTHRREDTALAATLSGFVIALVFPAIMMLGWWYWQMPTLAVIALIMSILTICLMRRVSWLLLSWILAIALALVMWEVDSERLLNGIWLYALFFPPVALIILVVSFVMVMKYVLGQRAVTGVGSPHSVSADKPAEVSEKGTLSIGDE